MVRAVAEIICIGIFGKRVCSIGTISTPPPIPNNAEMRFVRAPHNIRMKIRKRSIAFPALFSFYYEILRSAVLMINIINNYCKILFQYFCDLDLIFVFFFFLFINAFHIIRGNAQF